MYTLQEIAHIIGSNNQPFIKRKISYLLTDSRSLAFPENSLFFALKTHRNDGHKYISELYHNNVRSFVVDESFLNASDFPEADFLFVDNTLDALQQLAAAHRSEFSVPVVGITGSNGKTIVKEWIYQLMHEDKSIVRSPRSYNSQIGVPLSIWQLNEHTELGLFEAGISEKNEMRKLQKVIDPTVCILTNIGDAHQENFASPEEKCMEKLQLAQNADVLICNTDNDIVRKCIRQSAFSGKLFSWSKTDRNATLYISDVKKELLQTCITADYQNKTYSFNIPFTDEASIENAIHCFAFLLYMDVPEKIIRERMSKLEQVAMRLEVKEGKNKCVLINDSYNSDVLSLDIALDFQQRRDTDKSLEHILILSDILQSGISNNVLYERIARLIKERRVDYFIGIGSHLTANAHLFEGIKTDFFNTTTDFLHANQPNKLKDAIVLIKGARPFHFEKITESLALKVHETILEVDLNAIIHNYNFYREKIAPSTKMISMVKAFAYGAGAYEVAKTLQEHRCDYLAVAVADEGADLRKNGIHIPILVMNPEMTAFQTIFEHQLEPEIYGFRLLQAFIKEADRYGIVNYPVHIKIDTGMHRLGFTPEEIGQLAELLNKQTNVVVRSVFSHLAGSDEARLTDFTQSQIRLFTECCNSFDYQLGYKPLRHILNSEGILHFPEAQMDMVRLGLGLYGVNSIGGLQNVTTLKTIVLQIHEIAAGETIGYSRKGIVSRNSRIATLPIGYADGLNRKLGNGNLSVLINNQFVPTIGNICMDLTMIDVTDIECKEGDEVIIFGEKQPTTVLAEKLDTIPYEIITSVSDRVKRIYFSE